MYDEMYQENILDHYKHPHNKRVVSNAHMEAETHNASCGDYTTLQMCFDDVGHISDIAFQGEGCALSQAVLSMLTDMLKGKTLNELKLLSPGDIYTMLGVSVSPGRVNCALLGYAALQKILKIKN